MPPRGWKKSIVDDIAKERIIHRNPTPSRNDGTLSVDGVQIKPKVWNQCIVCGRFIFFVRIGDKCVFCAAKTPAAPTNV